MNALVRVFVAAGALNSLRQRFVALAGDLFCDKHALGD